MYYTRTTCTIRTACTIRTVGNRGCACHLENKKKEKKYKENLSKTIAKAEKPFACHLEGTNLHGPTKNGIALEASYLEDVSLAKGTGGVEEAESKKVVIL
jgi:hypothetical protein